MASSNYDSNSSNNEGPSDSDMMMKEHQPSLLVICAGLPRTGTSSFVAALKQIGIKTYHFEDLMQTPGHFDLWNGLYVTKTNTIDQVLDKIVTEDGYQATSDQPTCYWYKEQMDKYPDAKVVLTVRGDGDGDGDGNAAGRAWAKSAKLAMLDINTSMRQIPFRWIPFVQIGDKLVRTMIRQGFKTDEDPQTLNPKLDQLPGVYDEWVKEVKSNVPSDKLLVHAAQDGWGPLCEFLSPLSPEIKSNCDTILASKVPYPHVFDKKQIQTTLKVIHGITFACKALPSVIVVVVVAVIWWQRRGNGYAQSGVPSVSPPTGQMKCGIQRTRNSKSKNN